MLANNYDHMLAIHDQQKPQKFEAFAKLIILIKINFHGIEIQNLLNLDNFLNALYNVHLKFSLIHNYLHGLIQRK
jgi:hypothetical protein